MTSLGSFQPSAFGMAGHSHALATISANIANMTTTGYKQSDTSFTTLLSRQWGAAAANPAIGGPLNDHADIGGIRGLDTTRVAAQGAIQGTGGSFDVAISGAGLFALDTRLDGGGERVFSRDGAFAIGLGGTPGSEEGYLVDANGYYVLGYPIAGGGTSPAVGQPGAMRVDAGAFTDQGQPTTAAALSLNLPASVAEGSARNYRMEVYDEASRPRRFDLSFVKADAPNTWGISVSGGDGETVTVEPALADGAAGAGEPLRFDTQGALLGPTAYTIGVADADGGSVDFSLDLSALTQYAGDFVVNTFTQDGAGAGSLASVAFDSSGDLVGTFDNGRSRPLYTLALADFANPDGLNARNGTVFSATERSGTPLYGRAGANGIGTLSPGAIELSTVDLEEQFAKMILTQNAYNSSATAFRTVNEMTETARELKR